MRAVPYIEHPNLLVGYDVSDDAGVYRLKDNLALVQTVDFITPVVDDPYLFGMIAAANSISDVYAMGGRPITAMNLLCFPSDDLPVSLASEILKGGQEKIIESGTALIGGHSIKDNELKYGLSVTGIVHPDRIMSNKGARAGDKIILTKPIGTGIVSTALKGEVAGRDSLLSMVETASELNRVASEVMLEFEAHACTDITGFGLGGHLLEVARASNVEITLNVKNIPLMPGVEEYALQGLIPGGTHSNRKFFSGFTEKNKDVKLVFEDIVFDPQTSGGLVIFTSAGDTEGCLRELHRRGVDKARIVGEVTGKIRCGKIRLV